jgi:hypothetical protein
VKSDEGVVLEAEFYVDPAEVFVEYNGRKYYRDGVLYGSVLKGLSLDEPDEHPLMPTLWSMLVIDYRRRPIQVKAIQLRSDNAESVAEWCGGQTVEEIERHEDGEKRFVGLNIPTLDGVIRASEGDYVVKEAHGGFTKISAQEFSSTYEMV